MKTISCLPCWLAGRVDLIQQQPSRFRLFTWQPCYSSRTLLMRCSDISLEKNWQNSQNILCTPWYSSIQDKIFLHIKFISCKLTKPVFLRQRWSSKIPNYLEYSFSVNIIHQKIFNNNKMNFSFFLWIELIGNGSSANHGMKIILFVRNQINLENKNE